jgi:hypothetical protein
MMIVAGQTAHYVVSYDDSLSNGAALANAILGQCEQDLSALSALYVVQSRFHGERSSCRVL